MGSVHGHIVSHGRKEKKTVKEFQEHSGKQKLDAGIQPRIVLNQGQTSN